MSNAGLAPSHPMGQEQVTPLEATSGSQENYLSPYFLNSESLRLRRFQISPWWLRCELVISLSSSHPMCSTVTNKRLVYNKTIHQKWTMSLYIGLLVHFSLSQWLATKYMKLCILCVFLFQRVSLLSYPYTTKTWHILFQKSNYSSRLFI